MRALLAKLNPSATTRYKVRKAVAATRSSILTVGGLGFLCGAAYYWETIAGLCATGVTLLVLDRYWEEGNK